jgi:hypothetical protein
MNADEREHWTRQMLARQLAGEPLVRPSYCRILSIYGKKALNRLIVEGVIPTIQVGKCVYVIESVIADWIVAENMRRFHTARINPIHGERTNHDPTRGHPMDDLKDDDQEMEL